MKKAFTLFYFLIGGSLIVFILSLLGCEQKKYKFIYKIGKATCFKQDENLQMQEITDSVAFDSLFVVEHFENQVLTSANLHLFNNNLYATEIPEPNYMPAEKLTEIKIYTINDYNAQYPAGSDITPICRFMVDNIIYNIDNNPNDSSKTWVLNQLNLSNNYSFNRNVGFNLTEAPASKASQSFAFEIRTEINELLRDTSKAIVIHP